MTKKEKIKTCPVERCKAKGGPAHCRYHAGVLLGYVHDYNSLNYYANQEKQENTPEYKKMIQYAENMIKWYKKHPDEISKKELKQIWDAINNIRQDDEPYQKLTNATIRKPEQEKLAKQILEPGTIYYHIRGMAAYIVDFYIVDKNKQLVPIKTKTTFDKLDPVHEPINEPLPDKTPLTPFAKENKNNKVNPYTIEIPDGTSTLSLTEYTSPIIDIY